MQRRCMIMGEKKLWLLWFGMNAILIFDKNTLLICDSLFALQVKLLKHDARNGEKKLWLCEHSRHKILWCKAKIVICNEYDSDIWYEYASDMLLVILLQLIQQLTSFLSVLQLSIRYLFLWHEYASDISLVFLVPLLNSFLWHEYASDI